MKVRIGLIVFFFASLVALGLATCPPAKVSLPPAVTSDPFMFMFKSVTVKSCAGSECQKISYAATGSGFVMGNNGEDTFVMTAGHICEEDEGVEVISSDLRAWSFSGRVFKVKVLNVYPKDDVCVVVISGRTLDGYSVSQSAPSRGDKVYTLAAPRGIWSPRMTPIFDGYYAGKKDGWDAYTIPVAGGSSGSPILNENGVVIGMTVAKYRGFENFGLSSSWASVWAAYKDVGLAKKSGLK